MSRETYDSGAEKNTGLDSPIATDKIEIEKTMSPEIEVDSIDTGMGTIDTGDQSGMSEAERIEAKSNYSPEVNSYIRSEAELDVYQKANLEETEIGGKKALVRNDIDWESRDEKGRTNSMRIERGLAPLDSDGDSIELHHVGQKVDSPLAELTFEEHRGKGNDTILHDKSIESEAHAEGTNWDTERKDYWMSRADYNKEADENE